MKSLKTLVRAAKGLGLASLVAGVLSLLALQDIYHGEADPRLEWMIVRVSAVIIAAFTVLTLIALGRVSQREKPES